MSALMLSRREAMAMAAAALTASRAFAAPKISHLQTRLFNFRDGVLDERARSIVTRLKNAAAGSDGFMIGRNMNATPFPTRFEWIYMIQFNTAAPAVAGSVAASFQAVAADLSAQSRDEAQCDLHVALPARYADARGVGVRHTVMFDFKPDAPQDARERIVAAIEGMGRLPMVRRYMVERSASAPSSPSQMEWQVVADYADAAVYKAYSDAPIHLALRDDFRRHTSRVAFLDVQL